MADRALREDQVNRVLIEAVHVEVGQFRAKGAQDRFYERQAVERLT